MSELIKCEKNDTTSTVIDPKAIVTAFKCIIKVITLTGTTNEFIVSDSNILLGDLILAIFKQKWQLFSTLDLLFDYDFIVKGKSIYDNDLTITLCEFSSNCETVTLYAKCIMFGNMLETRAIIYPVWAKFAEEQNLPWLSSRIPLVYRTGIVQVRDSPSERDFVTMLDVINAYENDYKTTTKELLLASRNKHKHIFISAERAHFLCKLLKCYYRDVNIFLAEHVIYSCVTDRENLLATTGVQGYYYLDKYSVNEYTLRLDEEDLLQILQAL